ncbi:MAG TPA: ROK family transcriptional regulator [Solirubrobacteraceae bacterium]|jgi:predicted NBD/HSP70 family sugar kinase|nr:ROK family transcriptional regulator [Solirubrobacteraceae bacterium]
MQSPANQRAVRRHNLGIVLGHVVGHGPRSRATIAQETGLNKSTVSSLVTELIELGLLAERGTERTGSVGRPGLVVEVSATGAAGVGLEVNVDYLSVRVVDLAGGVRHRALQAADLRGRPPEETLDRLAAMARSALERLEAEGVRAAGITVALPGLVDAASGTLLLAPNLHWEDVPVATALAERLGDAGPPPTADNEANLAAVAEAREGAGRGLSSFVHVSGEVGIGAGVVIDGAVFRGAHGFGGEFGHMTVDPDGPPCACGSRGCLETRAGLEALLAAAGEPEVDRVPSGEPVTRLASRADAGDAAAVEALRDAGHWLGIALGSAANLLDPQAFVLGGFLAPLAAHLAPAAEEEMRGRVLGAGRRMPDLITSPLGPEAAVRGAAALALARLVDDPGMLAEDARD